MTHQSIYLQEDNSHAVLDETHHVSGSERSSRLGTLMLAQRRIQTMSDPTGFGRATRLMGDLTTIGIDMVDEVWTSC